jgi:molecular chaperone GrpE (heat shock protein)
MGQTNSAPPVSAEDHENQVRSLRDRNERRRRELVDTWQARYDTLNNELNMIKKIAGGCCVVAGLTIVYLVRRGSGGGSEIQNMKNKLLQEVKLAKHTAARDVADAKIKGIKALSSDLLNVVDDLEHAIVASSNSGNGNSGKGVEDGIKLVHGNLLKVLDTHGVRPINAFSGANFDPLIHEAVSVKVIDNAEEQKEETIAAVAQEGYMLNDLILRASRVVVYKDK